MDIRLQKYLSDCGVASRRKSEEIILSGRVKVNGEVIEKLGTKIELGKDTVHVNDVLIRKNEDNIYIMLHKPEGYITSSKDQFERETVIDLITDVDQRIYPVGRLDYETSGLLILTNDGSLTFRLTHPKHEVDKTYIAKVIGFPTKEKLEQFRNGVFIDGYKTAPAIVEIINRDERLTTLKITIREGKNRQIRKMCEIIGHKVANLKRIAIGGIALGELKKGEYRNLTKEEVEHLSNV